MKRAFILLLAALILVANISPVSAIASGYLEFSISNLYENDTSISSEETRIISSEIYAYIDILDACVNPKKADSDVSKINSARDNEIVYVNADTIALIRLSKELNLSTDGYFNIAVGGLVELWGFSPAFEGKYSDPRPEPLSEDILRQITYSDINSIIIDESNLTVTKTYAETKLDFGGIAKGYLCDNIRKILSKHSVTDGGISVLSSILTIGNNKLKNSPFTVGVVNPKNKSNILVEIYSSYEGVSTSGDYERFYEYDGKRYCHIIDPFTGYPSFSDISGITVTVDASNNEYCATYAEAYSTALFCMGKDKAIEVLSSDNSLGGVIIDNENNYELINVLKVKKTENVKEIIISVIVVVFAALIILFLSVKRGNNERK